MNKNIFFLLFLFNQFLFAQNDFNTLNSDIEENDNYIKRNINLSNKTSITIDNKTKIKLLTSKNTIIIEIADSDKGKYEFSIDNILWQNSNEFHDLPNGIYTIFIRNLFGETIKEERILLFDIPNVITPNGDNLNDTWKIEGIENYPNTKITVMDRQGKIVLDTKVGNILNGMVHIGLNHY